MTIEIRNLQQFVVLAEELHFTRAADRLHITQPTLTNQIKLLEGELGLTLFTRSTRTVTLTDAGKHVLEKAKAALAAFDDVARTATSLQEGTTGHVAIGLPPRLRWPRPIDIERNVQRAARGITTDFAIEANSILMERVLRGTLDLAICYGPVPSEDLRSRVVRTDHAVAVMLETHPLADRPSVSLKELVDDPLILPTPRVSTEDATIENWYRGAGIKRTVADAVSDYDESHSAVLAGLGVEISPSLLTNTRQTVGLTAVRVAEAEIMAAPLHIVWRANDQARALATVVKCVTEMYGRV